MVVDDLVAEGEVVEREDLALISPYITGYTETVNLIVPQARWTLQLPSAYLPHAPATLTTVRGSTTGLPVTTVDPVSLHDPFHQQLQAFHHAVTEGTSPLVDGSDAIADLALVERIITAAARGGVDATTARES